MKNHSISYINRTYKELANNKKFDFDDSNHIASVIEQMKDTLMSKPTGFNPDEICQLLVLKNNVVRGCLVTFTNYMMMHGKKTEIQSGSYLYADPEAREHGMGSVVFMQFSRMHNNGVYVGSVSQKAQPI